MTTVAFAPTIWRTKLRSLKPAVSHQEQVAYNFDDGIVGIGWGIEALPDGASLKDVLATIDSQPGWTKDAVHTVRRFGEDAEIGDYIWMRDLHGRFRLGRITGPYRYENTDLAKRTDTHQVRDCQDLDALAAAPPNTEAILFACSASGQFTGCPPREIRCISPIELVDFMHEHERLLPPRVRTWF